MKIITEKKRKRFALFLLISGIGALWLTFWWYWNRSYNGMGAGRVGFIESFSVYSRMVPTLLYYLFNSVLLIVASCSFLFKRFKSYSILAVLLGVSVTGSLFVFQDLREITFSNLFIDNLFINTVFDGMVFGMEYGGTILVPMFLYSVYKGAFRGIGYLRGRVSYAPLETIAENQIDISSGEKI
jgi:hypothetical protein